MKNRVKPVNRKKQNYCRVLKISSAHQVRAIRLEQSEFSKQWDSFFFFFCNTLYESISVFVSSWFMSQSLFSSFYYAAVSPLLIPFPRLVSCYITNTVLMLGIYLTFYNPFYHMCKFTFCRLSQNCSSQEAKRLSKTFQKCPKKASKWTVGLFWGL